MSSRKGMIVIHYDFAFVVLWVQANPFPGAEAVWRGAADPALASGAIIFMGPRLLLICIFPET